MTTRVEQMRRRLRRWLDEQYRQWHLTHSLGQVSCSPDTEQHDANNLPCPDCGAAL